ncbi:MAG: Na+/H+ antiporter subunit E [Synergistaceae bacterium]|nr:Na+/H+ antiporter subunit E [Synergistaceae bacterium]
MTVFVLTFLTFLLLSFDGGFAIQSVVIGIVFAFLLTIITASIERKFPASRFSGLGKSGLVKWIGIVRYIFGPFAVGLYQANVDVAKRIIFGNINPGIIKFHPKLRTEEGRTFLADSITLTPGTLTVDIDEEGYFYIHWINVESMTPNEEQICGPFAKWARRLFG